MSQEFSQAMAAVKDTVPLISTRGLSKSFAAVRALSDVSVDFTPGRVHGLVGANGAGKSTFLRALGGLVQPEQGEIWVGGRKVTIPHPQASAALGFSFIHQEIALVPEFSAIENMSLPMKPRTFGGIGDGRSRHAAASRVAKRLGLDFSLDRPVRELTVAERGLVAIGRALISEARFVSMDEPTAALSNVECERLFAIVRELAKQDVAVAYVSHRLDEIEDLCDDVTVFKDGRVTGNFTRGNYSRKDLVEGITGTPASSAPPPSTKSKQLGKPLLTVRHLSGGPRVSDVSFTLHSGEILGLAGVVGSGRTEVCRILFGADQPDGGEMLLNGKPYQPGSPRAAISNGVALVPEERRSQALLLEETISFNINMGNWKEFTVIPHVPLISDRRARKRASEIAEQLRIKADSVNSAVRTLSGGNQQKVIFGRWLSRDAHVLILDEPTRGVDIGARQQIWQTAEEFAAHGKAVLVASSELEELAVCHRLIVLVEGRSVAEIEGPGVSENQILDVIYQSQKVS